MMKSVFICSPYAGDIEQNTKNAKRYTRLAIQKNCIPFTPHLLYPQVLREDDPVERAKGIELGLYWLAHCDELWGFGDHRSEGMVREIEFATELGMKIRYFPSFVPLLLED